MVIGKVASLVKPIILRAHIQFTLESSCLLLNTPLAGNLEPVIKTVQENPQ